MSNQPTPATRARDAVGLPAQRQEQPGNQLAARVEQRIRTVQSMLPAFVDAMRGEVHAKQLIRDAITCLRTTPKLATCTEPSFLGALMTCAQLDLRPNVPAFGHAWILPYENKRKHIFEANFQLGYPGVVELGARSGVSIMARTIYENEEYVIEYGLNEQLHHIPLFDKEKRGAPILHYAIARSPSGMVWTVLSHQETLAARDRSPGYVMGGADNPWRKDEQNGWPMSRKTAVLRLKNFIPKNSKELVMGMTADGTVRNDTRQSVLDPDAPDDGAVSEPLSYAQVEDDPPVTVESGPPREQVDIQTLPSFDVPEYVGNRTAYGNPDAPVRRALKEDLIRAHGAHSREALTAATGGEAIPFDLMTLAEVRDAIKITLGAEGNPIQLERVAQPENSRRKALMKRLQDAHPSAWRSALNKVIGEPVEPEYATDNEVIAATKVSTDDLADWMIDQAASADGA